MTQSNILLIHNKFFTFFSGEQMFECHIAVHEVNLNGHVMVELVKVKYGYEITPQKCRKAFHPQFSLKLGIIGECLENRIIYSDICSTHSFYLLVVWHIKTTILPKFILYLLKISQIHRCIASIKTLKNSLFQNVSKSCHDHKWYMTIYLLAFCVMVLAVQ